MTVAAIDEMPVSDIHLLLSNDLAGDQVKSLIVSEMPLSTMDDDKDDPKIFPICAVTRAQTREGIYNTDRTPDTRDLDEDIGLQSLFSEQSQGNRINVSSPEVAGREDEILSHAVLCKLQREDETLARLRVSTVSQAEVGTMPQAYHPENGALMRRWVPPRESPSNSWMAYL